MSRFDLPNLENYRQIFIELGRDIYEITLELFKILIPLIFIIKIIQEVGGVEYLSELLEPVMSVVGLPASMGLVWATAMIVNLYGGMVVFFTIASHEPLTVAQVTIICAMMLSAHNLLVEIRIAQKAGLRLLYVTVLRLGFAFTYGYILHVIYTNGHYLNQPYQLIWQPEIIDDSLQTWFVSQLQLLLQIILVITALVTLLRILKAIGVEALIQQLLHPFLRFMGLEKQAASFTLIGLLLGLAYGGSMLIREARAGTLSLTQIFGAISLLSVCHSLIEDTILMLLLGADWFGIIVIRVLFSILLIAAIMKFIHRLNEQQFLRYFAWQARKV